MGRVIAIANQKGGVGKTTTAINLSAAMGKKGKKVLVIDIDPQGNTTSGFGIEKNELDKTVYDLILGECSIKEAIIPDVCDNLSIIPANVNLAAAEIELIDAEKKEYVLKNEVDWIKDQYDYIFIDCPPSLSMLTVNAMTTAESVLVPIQCEYYAMEGVVFTMFDSRTNLSQEVVDSVKEALEERVFETTIPRNVRLAEAPSYGKPICDYDPKSAGAESYNKLAEEIIKVK